MSSGLDCRVWGADRYFSSLPEFCTSGRTGDRNRDRGMFSFFLLCAHEIPQKMPLTNQITVDPKLPGRSSITQDRGRKKVEKLGAKTGHMRRYYNRSPIREYGNIITASRSRTKLLFRVFHFFPLSPPSQRPHSLSLFPFPPQKRNLSPLIPPSSSILSFILFHLYTHHAASFLSR